MAQGFLEKSAKERNEILKKVMKSIANFALFLCSFAVKPL